ncbi:MAG: hypothetical protein MR505_03985, partial [Bacteroidales bacterium]|nr:hypothetical protein [Bacteroidales bacterium]
KCIIFVLAKRREPANTGSLLFFSYGNGLKKGFSTKHVEKFICRSENFFSESGFSIGEVGARIDDIDTSKVKRYLFFIPAFFTFQVTTQVAHCGLGMLFGAPPAGRTDGIIPPIISTQPIHFFGQQRSE